MKNILVKLLVHYTRDKHCNLYMIANRYPIINYKKQKGEKMKAYDLLANMVNDFIREDNGYTKLPAYLDSLIVDINVDEKGNITKEETGVHISARIIPYKQS